MDYEESLARCGLELRAGISLSSRPRLLARDRVVAWEALRETLLDTPILPCAFSPDRRRELWDLAQEAGFELAPALIDPSASVARSTRLGAGCFVNAATAIGGASILGTGVLVNRSANIGHHCLIADFASIGPGASLAGNIRVGRGATIGVGAVIYPDVRKGDGAVVAGGSVVRRDVDAETVVSGHPAKPTKLPPSRTILRTSDQE